MTVEILSRIQFALTISFHYICPPLSIGLGVVLVIMNGCYLKTRDPLYRDMAKFWTKIFGVIFAIGVATGIVMEFEFGTNWASYSRFVGDVFGSALAAEGIFAFFLESGFLAILLFGWDRVSSGVHFFATCMVALGAHFSAVWIVVANSWMQTPAGYHIEVDGQAMPLGYSLVPADLGRARAVIDDFWAMVFNPSSMDRLTHVILGAWLAGGCLVLSISAYYLLKNRHRVFAERSFKIAFIFVAITIVLQWLSGDDTARGVAENQPMKFAAMEGVFETKSHAGLGLIGWVDGKAGKTYELAVPDLLSVLVGGSPNTVIQGLNSVVPEDRPAVNATYQCYHIMVGIAGLILLMVMVGCWLWYKKKLFDLSAPLTRLFMWSAVVSVFLVEIANQAGWFTAELGRQPWIVYGLMRTSQGLSKVVKNEQVLFSLILFTFIYLLLL
ncbi:MAG: cytochrome ubiquinol oxidase subunit I, partial [Verrucomicrobia bacterium 21-51-4]